MLIQWLSRDGVGDPSSAVAAETWQIGETGLNTRTGRYAGSEEVGEQGWYDGSGKAEGSEKE